MGTTQIHHKPTRAILHLYLLPSNLKLKFAVAFLNWATEAVRLAEDLRDFAGETEAALTSASDRSTHAYLLLEGDEDGDPDVYDGYQETDEAFIRAATLRVIGSAVVSLALLFPCGALAFLLAPAIDHTLVVAAACLHGLLEQLR